MNKKFLKKYFRNQCSSDELEQVLTWFQTSEGQDFLEQEIKRECQMFRDSKNITLYPEIESEKIFNKILLKKKPVLERKWWFNIRVAAIIFVCALFSFLMFWDGIIYPVNSPSETKSLAKTFVTLSSQQKKITLSNGTKIRLNKHSTLTVPAETNDNLRTVRLRGEAYFDVDHDSDHPFVVQALGTKIHDLGTQFNVKTNSVAQNVQVAVIQGEVFMNKQCTESKTGAQINKNHFGIMSLTDGQITIEKDPRIENYRSWINKRLVI